MKEKKKKEEEEEENFHVSRSMHHSPVNSGAIETGTDGGMCVRVYVYVVCVYVCNAPFISRDTWAD